MCCKFGWHANNYTKQLCITKTFGVGKSQCHMVFEVSICAMGNSRAVEEGGGAGGMSPPLQFQGGLSPPSTFYKQYIPQLKGLFQK